MRPRDKLQLAAKEEREMKRDFRGVFDLEQIREYAEANIDRAEWIEGPCGEKRRTLVIDTLVDSWHGHHIPEIVLELFGEADGYGPELPEDADEYDKSAWVYDTLTLLENTITDALNELLPSPGYYYIGYHEFDGSYCLFYEEYEEEEDMIEVVIIEAGPDYLDKLEIVKMALPADEDQAVAEAMKAVESYGYTVIPNDQGGCCAYVSASFDEDWIAITVEPNAEEEEEEK
jgi:hypothetical protein